MPRNGFLFPVRALSKVFRGKFAGGLEARQSAERLPEFVAATADWQRLKQRPCAHDWVVYAKQPLGGPEAVLECLGRYTHRVAMLRLRSAQVSNERIRHYGLLSPARKKAGLATARAALGMPPPQPALIESVAEFMRRVERIEHGRCPHCGIGRLRLTATLLPERRRPNSRAPP